MIWVPGADAFLFSSSESPASSFLWDFLPRNYLETRSDIDHGPLAYGGLSSSARDGPIFMALDHRFKAAVLIAAGIGGEFFELLPEANVVNFAPRCRSTGSTAGWVRSARGPPRRRGEGRR